MSRVANPVLAYRVKVEGVGPRRLSFWRQQFPVGGHHFRNQVKILLEIVDQVDPVTIGRVAPSINLLPVEIFSSDFFEDLFFQSNHR